MTRKAPQATTTETRPSGGVASPWAVALLVASTGFAAAAIMLLTTGFGLA